MRFAQIAFIGLALFAGTVSAQVLPELRTPEILPTPADTPIEILPDPTPSLPPGYQEPEAAPYAQAIPHAAASPGVTLGPAIPVSPRPIRYAHHRTLFRTRTNPHLPPINTTLLVEDPRQPGCIVPVPVCLPSCCEEDPHTHCGVGLLGRGIVKYHYRNGYRLKILFERDGEVVVHSYGR